MFSVSLILWNFTVILILLNFTVILILWNFTVILIVWNFTIIAGAVEKSASFQSDSSGFADVESPGETSLSYLDLQQVCDLFKRYDLEFSLEF